MIEKVTENNQLREAVRSKTDMQNNSSVTQKHVEEHTGNSNASICEMPHMQTEMSGCDDGKRQAESESVYDITYTYICAPYAISSLKELAKPVSKRV